MNIENFSPLIHIGFHKTATTFLQKNIFSSSEYKFYPITDSKHRHDQPKVFDTKLSVKSFAGYFFAESHDGFFLSPYENRTEEIHKEVEIFLKKINYDSEKICVLSNERLCGAPHSGFYDSKSICDRIYDAFPNAKILITIREQKSMIKSLYFQYIVEGGTKNISKYLTQKYNNYATSAFRASDLKYDALVGYYINTFGKSNVLTLPYEMLQNQSEDFFDRLYTFVDIDKPPIDLAKLEKANVTSSRYARFKMRHLFRLFNPYISVDSLFPNKIIFASLRIVANLISIVLPKSLDLAFQKKIESESEAYCIGKYEKSNKKLQQLINLDLENYKYSV